MGVASRVTSARDADHLKDSTAFKLLQNQFLINNIWKLLGIGLDAANKMRFSCLESLHKLVQLTLQYHITKRFKLMCYSRRIHIKNKNPAPKVRGDNSNSVHKLLRSNPLEKSRFDDFVELENYRMNKHGP